MQNDLYDAPLYELIEAFTVLPGVGPKTAQRFAFHMLQVEDEKATALLKSLQHARQSIVECEHCHHWTMQSPCRICANHRRRKELICVVQIPQDVYAMERTASFNGTYHVLGGVLSPMEGIGPDALNIQSLLDRFRHLQSEVSADLKLEAVLALPPSTQGEMTVHYLSRQLKPLGVEVSRIAYGLPVGSELDYADQLTLTRAMEGRQLI